MRRLQIPPHRPVDELEQRYRGAHDPVARSQWQIMWLLASGQPTAAVAQSTGYSANWIREVARRYREDGPTGLGDRRPTNPGQAPLLDTAPQEQLRQALAGPAPEGGVGTGRWVAHWMSQTLDRPIHLQRGWEGRCRLGFTPQRPRPREPRADPEAPAACKPGGLPPPLRR